MAYTHWSKLVTPVDNQNDFLIGGGSSGFDGLETILQTMGWSLLKGGWSLANDYCVFNSRGEVASTADSVVRIWKSGSYVKFQVGSSYNSSTGQLINPSRSIGGLITSTVNPFVAGVWGDKDIVFIKTYVGSLRTIVVFGRVPTLWSENTVVAIPDDAIVAGSDVGVVVDTVSGFEVGQKYQFKTYAASAPDTPSETATLTDIDVAALTLTFDLLSYSRSKNTVIGVLPIPCFCNDSFSGLQYDLSWTYFDNTDATNGINMNACYLNSYPMRYQDQPDNRINKYVAEFLNFYVEPVNGGSKNFGVGYGNSRLMRMWTTTPATDGDVVYKNSLYGSASTGTNSATTLNDTGATWTVNEWADKIVVLTSGSAAGQIRKILSNTATELTISIDWETTPTTEDFVICDKGYRIHSVPGLSNFYLLSEEIE